MYRKTIPGIRHVHQKQRTSSCISVIIKRIGNALYTMVEGPIKVIFIIKGFKKFKVQSSPFSLLAKLVETSSDFKTYKLYCEWPNKTQEHKLNFENKMICL